MKKLITLLSCCLVMLSACKKDDPDPVPVPPGNPGDPVVLIANEGSYGSGYGTVSRLNLSSGSIENELFYNVNGYPLGNVVLSVQVHDDKAFVMVNNSEKIEVVDYPEFTSVHTIENLGETRYMVTHNGKGFVSDWTINGLRVIDLDSYEVTGTITTGSGAEAMLVHNGLLYVANSGGNGVDNRVSVVDPVSELLLEQIIVADNPISMAVDANGNIQVLCFGVWDWQQSENDTPGALVEIDPDTQEVTHVQHFGSVNQHPSDLAIDHTGQFLYYLLDGDIYKMNIGDELPVDPLISGNFSGLGFHPEAQTIIATEAPDYVNSGNVYLLDEDGNQQAVFEAGVAPGSVLPL